MKSISKSAIIPASVEEVFDYIDSAENLPSFWTALERVKSVERLEDGRKLLVCEYKMAGIRFDVETEDTLWIKNKCIKTITKGGISAAIRWDFSPAEGGTRLTFSAEYTVPVPIAGKFAEIVIAKKNNKDVIYLINNLRLRFISQQTSQEEEHES